MKRATRLRDEYCECDACASKPGAPELCAACLHNRTTINDLKRRLARLHRLWAALRMVIELEDDT